jgi:GDPmannose 4,6-dehydratase
VTRAMVVGVSGQTGAYLCKELLDKGIEVVGTSRDHGESNLWRLSRLSVLESVELVSLSLRDPVAIRNALRRYEPDQIYYLAGPSSVSASFREPRVSMDQIFQPIVTFLEELKDSDSSARFFNACSTDCFGNQPMRTLDEKSALQPVSPYAVAKTAAYWTVKNYREAFGMNASNGILTNHESPLRGPGFVTQKIRSGLIAIAEGRASKLALGSTSVSRDWLWAGDVAAAISSIGFAGQASDYLVASGRSATLQEFIDIACAALELSPADVISKEESLVRPTEIEAISLNPEKAKKELGWSPEYSFEDIVTALIRGDLGPVPENRRPG